MDEILFSEEYQFMDDRSQGILFDVPNTSFQGINERERLDTSTFREAVGRYNYLAARVPGANGLINPNPSPFPINTLILISLGLVGLFAIFVFIKFFCLFFKELTLMKKHTRT